MKQYKKIVSFLAMLIVFMTTGTMVRAAEFSAEKDGTYVIDAELSCFVNAMGGVEFGAPLLKQAEVTIQDGVSELTLTFTTAPVTIYGSTAHTYFSPLGLTGYHEQDGDFVTEGVEVVTEIKTIEEQEISYVASMTFPLEKKTDTYELGIAVCSVGGMSEVPTQFGAGSNYAATLTVDWTEAFVTEEEPNVTIGWIVGSGVAILGVTAITIRKGLLAKASK